MPDRQFKPIRSLTPKEIQRFEAKIDKSSSDGCWPWTAMLNDKGYGVFCIDRKRFSAPRVRYFITHGIDPGPLLTRHTCDFKPCVRDDHIILGTNEDNMRDAVERKRFATGLRNGAYTHPEKRHRGEAQKLAKLTDKIVKEIRVRYHAGETGTDLAHEFKVSPYVVHRILRGIIWKHVGGPIVEGKLPKGPKRKTRWGPLPATPPKFHTLLR